MNAVNYTTARKNLAGMMDRVCQDCDTVIITKNNNCAVVMMPLSDYESLMETDYLLRNRANAAHLRKSMESVSRGRAKKVSMKELDIPADSHCAAIPLQIKMFTGF